MRTFSAAASMAARRSAAAQPASDTARALPFAAYSRTSPMRFGASAHYLERRPGGPRERGLHYLRARGVVLGDAVGPAQRLKGRGVGVDEREEIRAELFGLCVEGFYVLLNVRVLLLAQREVPDHVAERYAQRPQSAAAPPPPGVGAEEASAARNLSTFFSIRTGPK